jgi:NADH-quinone oxidoreductase subunit M
VGEFLVMLGAFQYSGFVAAWAMLVVIASAVYMLWMFQRAFFTVPSDWMKRAWDGLHDMNRLEWASLAPLVALVVLLGLYPAPILEATAEPVERILETVQAASGLDLVAWPW